jgi:hypothetical protein
MSGHKKTGGTFGLMAEFDKADDLLAATEKTRASGYQHIDTYAPFPVHGMSEVMGLDKQRNWVPYIVLLGAISGGVVGYMLQYYTSVIAYPMNIGSRPLNSWPAFLVITFEGAVLLAAVFGFVGMLALNKLPMPYHPVFNTPGFSRASRDGFFLCVFETDPQYDPVQTAVFLGSLRPVSVHEVDKGFSNISD